MAAMQKNTLKYSAVVFLGGASYGVMAATVKSAFAEGFAWAQTAASQAFSAAAPSSRLPSSQPSAALLVLLVLPPALLGLGLTTCTTCVPGQPLHACQAIPLC